MMSLIQDTYLLSGLALLAFSVFGMFWVLKALQKHSEENESIIIPAVPETPRAPRSAPAPEPVSKPKGGEETQLLQGREAAPSQGSGTGIRQGREAAPEETSPIDHLSEQIIHLEKKLSKISEQLEQIRRDKDPQKDLNAELQAALQSLKPSGTALDPNQIGQLSAKMDKIYNVLVTLSQSDSK